MNDSVQAAGGKWASSMIITPISFGRQFGAHLDDPPSFLSYLSQSWFNANLYWRGGKGTVKAIDEDPYGPPLNL